MENTVFGEIPRGSLLEEMGQKAFLAMLRPWREGCLELTLPSGLTHIFGDPDSSYRSRMHIRSFRAFKRILFGADVGFAEGFVEGEWDTDDLSRLLCLFSWNQRYQIEYSPHLAWLGRLSLRLFHTLRSNTLEGSRKNISAHYDLGNDLYTRFLDPTMMYSSAIFEEGEGDADLENAQIRKVDQLLEELHLGPEHHLLEIGSGWGFAACRAAQKFGCKVTSLTLSVEQKKLADERIAAMGLGQLVQVVLQDYRHEQGQYDRVLSIEMIEAVGHENLGAYFASIHRCLKQDGIAAIQMINMPESRYGQYLKKPDYIQRYIFPGAVCPSVQAVMDAVSKNSDLGIEKWQSFGLSYAQTLAIWKRRFEHRWHEIKKFGYDERFKRIWLYYLAYCEAGFRTHRVNVGHLVLSRTFSSQKSNWMSIWQKEQK